MKMITFAVGSSTKVGVLTADEKRVVAVEDVLAQMRGKSMVEFIAGAGPEQMSALKKAVDGETFPAIPLAEVKVLAPITRPIHDILCVGVNYKSHLQETEKWLEEENFQPPKSIYFTKRACEIMGPQAEIESHRELDPALDYEVELAVIIGEKCRDVSREKAEEAIFGYSVFNDLSARTLQRDHVQWAKGKSLDGLSAMGPVILTKDELPFPLRVDVICEVNGQTRQHSNTELFLNDVPGIIADLTAGMTLEPGDIIATGTPSGAAMGMQEPEYLKSGDEVVCRIPQIGALVNYVK